MIPSPSPYPLKYTHTERQQQCQGPLECIVTLENRSPSPPSPLHFQASQCFPMDFDADTRCRHSITVTSQIYSDRHNGFRTKSVCQTVRHHWHNDKLVHVNHRQRIAGDKSVNRTCMYTDTDIAQEPQDPWWKRALKTISKLEEANVRVRKCLGPW